jgi:glutamate-1-semialdehyde 2,1-aminomutase
MIKLDNKTEYDSKFLNSKKIYETDNKITYGAHSTARLGYPPNWQIYFRKAKGSRIWDVDGNEFLDLCCNVGACILGHGHPEVLNGVLNQIQNGLTVGIEFEITNEVAKMVNNIVPSAEVVKFSTTGSEVVMHAVQIARAYTGKQKIVKLEGGNNGRWDSVRISTYPDLTKAGPKEEPYSVPSHPGLIEGITESTLAMPFNDIDSSVKIIEKNKNDLAAVILEPVIYILGCVIGKKEYLKAIREVTQENQIPLIFDEIITGFRLAPGGAQEYYGVTPDMTTLGKAIGNGFPLTACVGNKEIMEVIDPYRRGSGKTYLPYAGTYNANQIGIAAARETLKILGKGHVQTYLHERTKDLSKGFDEIAEDHGVEAHIQQIAGKFQVYFTNEEIIDFRTLKKFVDTNESREKLGIFSKSLFDSGIFWSRGLTAHKGITYAHTKEDMNTVLEKMDIALSKVENM